MTGTFETIRHAAIIDVRLRKTVHGGKSPDIWGDFEERGWKGKQTLALDGDVDDE